jgi:hypothetical protein
VIRPPPSPGAAGGGIGTDTGMLLRYRTGISFRAEGMLPSSKQGDALFDSITTCRNVAVKSRTNQKNVVKICWDEDKCKCRFENVRCGIIQYILRY